jgi:hypothetical protein
MDAGTMVKALQADGPHPGLGGRSALFGQFVGAWTVDITNIAADGTIEEVQGEWHFGWALEGRAIVDVWVAPRRSLRDGSEAAGYGITVRCFDPSIDAWRVTWVGPGASKSHVTLFVARPVGDEIVLEASPEGEHRMHWIFSDITPDRFRWRSVESEDGGASWSETQRMVARRVSPGGAIF